MINTATVLQDVLDGLISTHITSKHIHWVVRGRTFQQAHVLLDELVTILQKHADVLAERMVYLAIPPEPFEGGTLDIPSGFIRDDEVYSLMSSMLDALSQLIEDAYDMNLDAASEDVLIAAQRDVDKYQWFFRSHV